MSELINNNILDSKLLINEKPPEEILVAQQQYGNDNKEEQVHAPEVHLFFSFDIVNSTMYKTLTTCWPIVIKALLDNLQKRVSTSTDLSNAILWRVIGDEMIFVIKVENNERLKKYVEAIFELTQRVTISLRNGKFFNNIKNQKLKNSDIEQLRIQSPLSVKSAAWIAAVSNENDFRTSYDCIRLNYATNSQKQRILEFLGSDIDAGFRLKQYTQDRRLAISFELACLLKEEYANFFIMDYVRLKGVWNEGLYPIIWYYNEAIVKACNKELLNESKEVPFSRSFRYDETDNNPLVNNYFARGKQQKRERLSNTGECVLAKSMYDAQSAIRKIAKDRMLEEKINYFKSLYHEESQLLETLPFENPLEFHCAVVCCDVETRTVMITHRGQEHDTNPGKWEFGCAKTTSGESIKKTIVDYYKTEYAIEVELVCDKEREEKQPIPLAVYEIGKPGNIRKGVIFIGKLKHKGIYRNVQSHDQVVWITENQIKEYENQGAVKDFGNTLRDVFKKIDFLK